MIKSGSTRWSLAFSLPALLVLAHGAAAQTAQSAAPAAGQSAGSVVVKGTRGSGSADEVIAGKSRVMSKKLASSCSFMSPGNPNEMDIVFKYMGDFGLENSNSFDNVERFSSNSPAGDVSNAATSSSLDGFTGPAVEDLTTPSVGCGPSDRRFAAGRQHIVAKDKSFALAFEAFDNKNYPQAMSLFKTAYSKVGYDEAALMLAKMNMYGLGTSKDMKEAIRWLKEVADGRFDPSTDRFVFNPKEPNAMDERMEATFMLARIYERGIDGVTRNPAEAKRRYAKAAEFGFVPAQNILAQGWLSGYAGEKSTSKALALFKEASEAGYVPAQFNLGKLYYNGDDGVQKDLKLAGAYFDAAAKAGHPGALFAAGRMYDFGESVPVDHKKALVYYKEAAVKGDRDAQFALGTFFYTGDTVAKDLATARKLFDAAAKQGQPDAMFNLGAMDINGEGGPRDLAMAYVWFSLAKTAGHESAGDALKVVAPKLTAQDHAKADAILKPQAKS
jgi:TPR repeat protein